MEKQSLKKLLAFIVTILTFSVVTETTNAQSKPQRVICTCHKRPIPPQCVSACGPIAEESPIIKISLWQSTFKNISDYGSSLTTLTLRLSQSEEEYSAQVFEKNDPYIMAFPSSTDQNNLQQKISDLEWGTNESVNKPEMKK